MRQTLAHIGDNKVMYVSDQVGVVQVLKESDLLFKEWLIMTLFLNGLDGISGASNPVLTLPHNSPGTPGHDGDERRGQSLH